MQPLAPLLTFTVETWGASVSTTTSIQLVRLALQEAEKKLGFDKRASRLKARDTTLRAWRDGHSAIPQSKFIILVELMSEVDPNWRPE